MIQIRAHKLRPRTRGKATSRATTGLTQYEKSLQVKNCEDADIDDGTTGQQHQIYSVSKNISTENVCKLNNNSPLLLIQHAKSALWFCFPSTRRWDAFFDLWTFAEMPKGTKRLCTIVLKFARTNPIPRVLVEAIPTVAIPSSKYKKQHVLETHTAK